MGEEHTSRMGSKAIECGRDTGRGKPLPCRHDEYARATYIGRLKAQLGTI